MAEMPNNGACKKSPFSSPNKFYSPNKVKRANDSKKFSRQGSMELEYESQKGENNPYSHRFMDSVKKEVTSGDKANMVKLPSSTHRVETQYDSNTLSTKVAAERPGKHKQRKKSKATVTNSAFSAPFNPSNILATTTVKRSAAASSKRNAIVTENTPILSPGEKPNAAANELIMTPTKKSTMGEINQSVTTPTKQPVLAEINKPVKQGNKDIPHKKKKQKSNPTEANASQKFAEDKHLAQIQLDSAQIVLMNFNQVQKLKKHSAKHPHALFICRLCQYHCDNWAVVENHILQTRHLNAMEVQAEHSSIKLLPEILPAQIEIFTKLIDATVEKYGISQEMRCARNDLAQSVSLFIQKHLPDCSVQLYGSSCTSVGLQNSDVNLNLVVLPEKNGPSVMKTVFELLNNDSNYSEVEFDLEEDFPRIIFIDVGTELKCNICLNNHNAYDTTVLLSKYETIDKRVPTLITAFRIWANICKLDRPDEGTLPPYAFHLMVVYYLQQMENPVLPVLHELVESNKKKEKSEEKSQQEKTGEKSQQAKSGKRSQQTKSEEKNQQEKLGEMSQQEKLEEKSQQEKSGERKQSGKQDQKKKHGKSEQKNQEENLEGYLDPTELEGKWATSNKMTVGELWDGLLNFYLIVIDMVELYICIRAKKVVTRNARKWPGWKLAIEDPFLPKQNVTRSMVHQASYDYLVHCLQVTYKYFRIPQTEQGALFLKIEEIPRMIVPVGYHSNSVDNSALVKKIMLRDPRFYTSDSCHPLASDHNLEQKLKHIALTDHEMQEVKTEEISLSMDPIGYCLKRAIVTREVALHMIKDLKPQYLMYTFEERNFSSGKVLPIVCTLCHEKDHLKNTCPEEVFPPMEPLSPMSTIFLETLSAVCEDIKVKWELTQDELIKRKMIVSELQENIIELYEDVSLKLFGSSCNGFGLHKSDLDICLTFESNESGKGLDFTALIGELHSNLNSHPKFTNLVPITTAKVPILKFYNPDSELEGDISFYNTLALQNTRLLKTYAEIDERVKVLGYVMKRFGKLCDICDASRGSLSSYAYVLMVIYFLQRCDPPVLPVLQELTETGTPPVKTMDDWNIYFYDDVSNVCNVWKDYGKNTSTVGELWIQLLCFYTEVFNFKRDVISIRQRERLLKFEKMWTAKRMAIEDPFDLNHNLGAGLSRKMHNYIVEALRKGRSHFGNAKAVPTTCNFPELVMYFFSGEKFTDRAPPNDRGCRICKKIGHLCRDCPSKKNKRTERKVFYDHNGRRFGNFGNPPGGNMRQGIHGRAAQNQGGMPRFGGRPNRYVGGIPKQGEYRQPERNGRDKYMEVNFTDIRPRGYFVQPPQLPPYPGEGNSGWMNNNRVVYSSRIVQMNNVDSQVKSVHTQQFASVQEMSRLQQRGRQHLRPTRPNNNDLRYLHPLHPMHRLPTRDTFVSLDDSDSSPDFEII